ncbi:MAG: oligopeptide/dipeptide ABC transporter ATP-binding protein [SAR324 cluster bacterium]|nr:oligopeptide/dipeptide ABC transporter ATP-binding protein [SAR324 cluster bacterium]
MTSSSSSNTPILRVQDLQTYFPVRQGLLGRTVGFVRAVDGVSFVLNAGETLGLVGESGCGKSTLARSLLYLHPPTGGRVWLKDTELSVLSSTELRKQRLRMQLIFQNPHASLNPRLTIEEIISSAARYHGHIRASETQDFATKLLTIEEIISSAARYHGHIRASETQDFAMKLLEQVGLRSEHLKRFPHEFSGGQRQRISIARALALRPEIVLCDEAVSSLDVSIQAQILNLLLELQQQQGLSYLFISHDLAVIQHLADRVAVMYLGRIVEIANRKELFQTPAHPYTQALLRAIPSGDPKTRSPLADRVLAGDVPSPTKQHTGCVFAERCPLVTSECRQQRPEFRQIRTGQLVACHHARMDSA